MSSIGTKGNRWPRKPPADAHCDASTGWHTGSLGEPIIDMCKQPAVETVKSLPFDREAWVCAQHAESLAASGQALRNPKAR